MGILIGNSNPLASGENVPTTMETYHRNKARENTKAAAKGLLFSPIGITLGAADTIGQSLGLLDEESMTNGLAAISEGGASVYRENRTGYRALGDIATLFTGAGATTKLLRGTSMLTRSGSIGAKAADAASKATNGRSDLILNVIRSDTKQVDQMVGQLGQHAAKLGREGVTDTVNLSGMKRLENATRRKQFGNDLKEGIAAEAFVITAQNESELFFPEGESTGDMLVWSGAGLVLGNTLGQVFLNPVLKKAHARAGQAKALREDELTQTDGVNLVMSAALADEVTNSPVIDPLVNKFGEAREQLNASRTNANLKVKESVTNMFNANPIPGITSSVGGLADSSSISTLADFAKTNPRTAARIVSADKPFALEAYTNKAVTLNKKYDEQVVELTKKRDAATGTQRIIIEDQIDAIKQSQIDLNGRITPARLDKLGQLSSDPSQPSIFDDRNTQISFKTQDVVGDDLGKTILFVNNKGDAMKVGIDVSGQLWRNGKKIDNTFGMSRYDESKIYAAQPRALKELGKILNAKAGTGVAIKPTVISPTGAHEQLDFVIEAVKEFGQGRDLGALAKVMDLSAFDSIEDLKYAAIQAKFDRYRVMMDSYEAGLKSGKDIANHGDDIGGVLMLKASSDHGENNYALQWFHNMRQSGAKSIGKNYAEAMHDFGLTFSMGADKRTTAAVRHDKGISLYEDLLEVNYIKKLNEDNKPITIFIENDVHSSDNFDIRGLQQVAQDAENIRQTKLATQLTSNPFTSGILGPLVQHVESLPQMTDAIVDGAKKVTQGAGSNPLTAAGQLTPWTKIFNLRGVDGAEAFSSYADGVQRLMRKQAETFLKENTTSMQALRLKGNETSAQTFLDFISAERLGWDLLDGIPDELGRFKLAPDSARNRAIVRHPSNNLKEVPEFMPSTLGNGDITLRMDELSAAALREARLASDVVWNSQNIISQSLGRKGLSYRNSHTLRPTNHDNRIYIADANGKAVDFVTGNTVEQAKQAAEKYRASLNKEALKKGKSGGYGLITKDSIEEYKIANDQMVTADALQFSSQGLQTQARGGRATLITDVKYIDDMLEEVQLSFQSMGKQYTSSRFANELENLRQLDGAAAVDTAGIFGAREGGRVGEKARGQTSVYQQMADQLTNTGRRNEGSLYGGIGIMAENALGTAWNKAFELLGTAGRAPMSSRLMGKVSRELADKYGYDPVTFAADFADKAIAGRTLPKGAAAVRKLAGWTQALALKWGEVGHAALTTASIVTTTPHAVKFMDRLKDESAADYKRRVGWASDLLSEDAAMPNPTKLTLVTSIKYARGDYKDVLADAAKLGYTDPNIAEFMEEFAQKRGGKIENLLAKLDKYTGLVSVTSEKWAREIAFLTGYEMYRNVGKQGHRVSMAAANDIANKAIADYRPQQRGELFKGTSGVPMAMFQTFAINYFQRLASAVENKAWGTALVQAGTQGFMFGGSSIPGYEILNETVLANWDQTQRPEDLFREGFESEALGQLMLYGTPSALPMILGADNGIALHTRGSMEIPKNITPATIFNTPFFSMVNRTRTALKQGFASARQEAGEGGFLALKEAAIYSIPNRPLRGIFEIAQGYSTNQNGDVVNDELQSWFAGLTHAAGLKTVRDAEKAELLWRDKQTQIRNRSGQRALSRAVEAQVRDGNFSGEDVASAIEGFISYGGSQRSAKRWLRNRLLKAEISKWDRELMRKLRGSERGQELFRYLQIEE